MIPLHFKKFNDKVRAMNSAHSREIRLTADEARALHTNIFALLEEIATLRETPPRNEEKEITIEIDAGDNSL